MPIAQTFKDDYAAPVKIWTNDVNLVLTAIALLQTDKTLHVPIDAIKSVKQGTQLEIKFDTLLDQYVIEAVEPQEEKETVIHADPPKKVYPY